MPKKYEVLMSTTYGEWVEVEADNEDQAVEKAGEGEWDTVVKSKMTDRYPTGDVREIVGEPKPNPYENALPRLMKEMEDEQQKMLKQ